VPMAAADVAKKLRRLSVLKVGFVMGRSPIQFHKTTCLI
jgi:hypothetical protein